MTPVRSTLRWKTLTLCTPELGNANKSVIVTQRTSAYFMSVNLGIGLVAKSHYFSWLVRNQTIAGEMIMHLHHVNGSGGL
jgi:hypothetical protein